MLSGHTPAVVMALCELDSQTPSEKTTQVLLLGSVSKHFLSKLQIASCRKMYAYLWCMS